MTFRDRVIIGIIASGLALALFAPSCDPKPTPQACAKKVGVTWTYEDGVTERLDAFQACMNGRG